MLDLVTSCQAPVATDSEPFFQGGKLAAPKASALLPKPPKDLHENTFAYFASFRPPPAAASTTSLVDTLTLSTHDLQLSRLISPHRSDLLWGPDNMFRAFDKPPNDVE